MRGDLSVFFYAVYERIARCGLLPAILFKVLGLQRDKRAAAVGDDTQRCALTE
jgi:hypothetical protein